MGMKKLIMLNSLIVVVSHSGTSLFLIPFIYNCSIFNPELPQSNFFEMYKFQIKKCFLTQHRNIQCSQYFLIVTYFWIQIPVFVYFFLYLNSTTNILFEGRRTLSW